MQQRQQISSIMLAPALLLACLSAAHAQQLVLVPGSAPLLRQAQRVDQVILPYENFQLNAAGAGLEAGGGNQPQDYKTSYVIDHKRFVEPYSSRCFSSTLLDDVDQLEPNFVIIRPQSEQRLNATAPAELISQVGRFDPHLPTTLIVHGFTQSYPSTDWLRKVRALFEMHHWLERNNLIIMDWGAASQGNYAQVAARVSGMGSFLANFLMKLTDSLGADRRSIHLIGHSLGAHLVGFAGKRLRPRVGRITGLDPAGPCFGKLFSNSANDRLSPDDAHQVDVFHYDDDFLGLAAQLGHWDVYVNGGSSQPGAVDNVNAMVQAVITMVFRRNRVLSESHTRSTEVATCQLSHAGGCQEIAYECRDWPAFLSGECGQCDADNSQCFNMGFRFQYDSSDAHYQSLPLIRSPRPPTGNKTPLFIATSPKDFYCLNHFQIQVNFEQAPDLGAQAKRNRWRLALELAGAQGERANVTLEHQMAPGVFTFLMLSEQAPIKFTSATLQVRQSDQTIVPIRGGPNSAPPLGKSPDLKRPYGLPYRLLSVEVNYMSHESVQVRRALSSRLCPSGWLTATNSIDHSSDHSNDDWLRLDQCRSS